MEFKSAEQALEAIRRTNNMSTHLEEYKWKQEHQERRDREDRLIDLFLRQNGFELCDANQGIIVSYFHPQDEIDRDCHDEVSHEGLQLMLADWKDRGNCPLAVHSAHLEWKRREGAIQELLGLFRDRDPNFLAVERRKLDFTPTDEIIQLVQNAKEGRRLQALSVDELKRERDAAKPAQPAVTLDPSRFTRGILLAMAPNQLRLLMQQLDVRSGIPGTGNRLVTERINNIS